MNALFIYFVVGLVWASIALYRESFSAGNREVLNDNETYDTAVFILFCYWVINLVFWPFFLVVWPIIHKLVVKKEKENGKS